MDKEQDVTKLADDFAHGVESFLEQIGFGSGGMSGPEKEAWLNKGRDGYKKAMAAGLGNTPRP
jgi:hypothetical protein